MHNTSGIADEDPGGTAPRAPGPPPAELRTLVRDCLDEVDALVDRYVDEVSAFDDYRCSVPLQDLRETARACFEMLLRMIGGLPVTRELRETPQRLGRRRARQGVPLERLLQAVRMDFRVLWEVFTERTPPEGLPQLTLSAVRVWEAVEFHTVEAHASYLDEIAVQAREREREKAAMIGRLLSSDGRDQQLVSQAATLLQADLQDRFAVAAALPEAQQHLRRAAARIGADAAHLHQHHGMLLLLARLPQDRRELPSDWLAGVPCAVAPVAGGLHRVPAMVRVAEAVAASLDGRASDPVPLSEAWMPLAAARLGDTGALLADSVLGALEALPGHERERLVATVTAYCDSGSVAETTRRLYCHRNTVLNRLGRFTELTGLRATRPAEAATILFALRCARAHPSWASAQQYP
ncbi:PucR family transcriptional regulator [Streptomyces sp. TR06-5]|uniref:PucR family transcriptional regulator n=1 Tax=Streptomyces sp. TR06-5 TaxID=3385976 RepID=UPI0039A065AA